MGLPQCGQTGRRYFHIFLPRHHFPNDSFVIEGFLTARLAALEQTIITLRIEQPLFVKSGFLKTVIHVRRDDEIVLVSHQLQKVVVDWLGRIHIAVDVNISAPICPMLLRRCKRIEPAGIHIPKAILCRKIGEVFFKPFAGIDESGGSGKPCARADNHGVAIPQSGFELLNLLGAAFRRYAAGRKISQKVLTDSLRSMEADGIIIRTVYPKVPPRVEYALSDLGGVHAPHSQSHGNLGNGL